jgi:membrane-anchored mycosin MYCP
MLTSAELAKAWRVINISAVTCLPANKPIDQTELGAALKYAAVQKDAVIVAAAGNNRGGLATGSACESNPLTDPARPGDPRNWAGVTSVSIPSWWQPYVLSVGSLTASGQPSEFTMAGPWLGIAAPGENIVSVSNGPGGGLANGLPNDQLEMFPISGTSYAAAYVSGVVALVRSNFPNLTAVAVMHRITAPRAARRARRRISSARAAWTRSRHSPGMCPRRPAPTPRPSGRLPPRRHRRPPTTCRAMSRSSALQR